jgi:hypothetical protein
MCDQTQGLHAQQIAPDSPVPFRSRETTAFPHVARMQSKRLRKLAGAGSLPVTAFALAKENGLLYGELRRIARQKMQELHNVYGFRPAMGSFRQR